MLHDVIGFGHASRHVQLESKLFCNWKNPKSKNYVDLWILEQFYNTHVILITVIDHN